MLSTSNPTPNPNRLSFFLFLTGVFNGEPYFKSIIQWLAASQAGRDVVYFPFETKMQPLADSLTRLNKRLQQRQPAPATVGEVFTAMEEFVEEAARTPSLERMRRLHNHIADRFPEP